VGSNSAPNYTQFAAKLNGMGIPATAAQVFNTISALNILL
jgi:4-nitrophenyl phosphatase